MSQLEPPAVEAAPTLSAPPKTLLHRIPWPLLFFIAVLIALILDRTHYLTHFGFVYTDADQATLWYQADDIAHGRIREPLFYGQSYNFPTEAWCAVPLLWLNIPAYMALPIATVLLALLPFLILAFLAYRRGHRWAASIILLIPLALSVEYTVVSSLPRSFINGLALVTPTLACWLFFRTRISFFLGGLFAILALTANPNSSILLLALGIYALLTNLRSLRFYLFSFLGMLTALPAPLLISHFYKLHPEVIFYTPPLPLKFTWRLLQTSLLTPSHHLNYDSLNLFFAYLLPSFVHGSFMLLLFSSLVVLLLIVRQFKAAVAVLLALLFALLCLGFERLHLALPQVFLPGSRMFLALPILLALALLWFDEGLAKRYSKNKWILPLARTLLIALLLISFSLKQFSRLDFPSPLVAAASMPPIDTVPNLIHNTNIVTQLCKKYEVDFVLVPGNFNCDDDSMPILSNHAFETLSPFFERRTFLITQERQIKRQKILLYNPSTILAFVARSKFKSTIISTSPLIMLIDTSPKEMTSLDIAAALGITYRAHM